MMRKKMFLLVLAIAFTTISCSDEVTEPSIITSGDELFCGKLDGSEILVSKNKEVEILRKKPTWCTDWNVFHRQAGKDTFIFSFCPSDCNERMNQFLWTSEGTYFAIFIENSNRFLGLNRLLLYKFKNGAIERKLDVKDKKISSFKFESDKFFVFTTKEGVESKTELD
jgi:hypothetical protein